MTRKKLIIYGNGQMARTLFRFAQLEFDVAAFTVDRAVMTQPAIGEVPVVAFEEVEHRYPPDAHVMITAVGYLQMNALRESRHRLAKAKGFAFANYIHPSVVIHPDVAFGENNVVLDHVSLHPGTTLGDGNFICSNVNIGHGCRIADYCWMNSGVCVGGETTIGSSSVLSINATIGDNITIAERCYVGPNTLVTRSTQPGEVYVSATGERFPLPSDAFLDFVSRGRG